MDRKKHLETILVLVVALGVVYWFVNKNNPDTAKYYLFAAGILGLIGIFIPVLADKIHWAWMKLAHVMGWVMSKVILTAVFFVFLLPMSMLKKAFTKKGSVMLKKDGAQSYYNTRNYVYTKDSLEHVW